jgi:hypothetical protein
VRRWVRKVRINFKYLSCQLLKCLAVINYSRWEFIVRMGYRRAFIIACCLHFKYFFSLLLSRDIYMSNKKRRIKKNWNGITYSIGNVCKKKVNSLDATHHNVFRWAVKMIFDEALTWRYIFIFLSSSSYHPLIAMST